MKHIYLNLKRFDVPAELGGVNRGTSMAAWGAGLSLIHILNFIKSFAAKHILRTGA